MYVCAHARITYNQTSDTCGVMGHDGHMGTRGVTTAMMTGQWETDGDKGEDMYEIGKEVAEGMRSAKEREREGEHDAGESGKTGIKNRDKTRLTPSQNQADHAQPEKRASQQR